MKYGDFDTTTRRQEMNIIGFRTVLLFRLAFLLCGFPALTLARAQTPAATSIPSSQPDTPGPSASGQQQPDPRLTGNLTGTIINRYGAPVLGALVKLTRDDLYPSQETVSDEDGKFAFAKIVPGPFHLAIRLEGFELQTLSGVLNSGESHILPNVILMVATKVTEIKVGVDSIEIAQEQLEDEEKQRLLGVIPNFYVSYVPNAVPLTSRQKFELAWKASIDPVTFGITGAIAGIEQSQDRFSGYGQGAAGYARRYGAAYGDFLTGTFIGAAILPSILKQDPRYFYKGTGTKRSRVLYAIANSVICKGDNGHWQANYSGILGELASGGISNLYYPATDRSGLTLTFENALIGIGASAATNILQEFVFKKLTPNLPMNAQVNP